MSIKKTVKRRWVILDHFFTTKLLVVENIYRRWGLICRGSQVSACECTTGLSPHHGFVGQTVCLEVSSKQIWYFNAFGLTIGTSLTSERVEVLDVNGCCIWFWDASDPQCSPRSLNWQSYRDGLLLFISLETIVWNSLDWEKRNSVLMIAYWIIQILKDYEKGCKLIK